MLAAWPGTAGGGTPLRLLGTTPPGKLRAGSRAAAAPGSKAGIGHAAPRLSLADLPNTPTRMNQQAHAMSQQACRLSAEPSTESSDGALHPRQYMSALSSEQSAESVELPRLGHANTEDLEKLDVNLSEDSLSEAVAADGKLEGELLGVLQKLLTDENVRGSEIAHTEHASTNAMLACPAALQPDTVAPSRTSQGNLQQCSC